MPTFNGELFIGESIESVLTQRMTDLELIVVNDGSTDNTLDIVQSYANKDARVRVINQPNSGGPSSPKNKGIAAACGDYIGFLDHDDLYDRDRIEQMVDGLDNHSEWIATFHDMRLIDSQGKSYSQSYLSTATFWEHESNYATPLGDDWFECNESFFIYQSLVKACIHTSTVLIAKKRLPNDFISFDTQFKIAEDIDLWIRMGLYGKIGYLNRTLSSYRKHEGNITSNRAALITATAQFHKYNFKRVEKRLTPNQALQLRSRIAGCVAAVAYLSYEQYRLKEARTAYYEALDWSFSIKNTLAYLKTFIPVDILRLLKDWLTNLQSTNNSAN